MGIRWEIQDSSSTRWFYSVLYIFFSYNVHGSGSHLGPRHGTTYEFDKSIWFGPSDFRSFSFSLSLLLLIFIFNYVLCLFYFLRGLDFNELTTLELHLLMLFLQTSFLALLQKLTWSNGEKPLSHPSSCALTSEQSAKKQWSNSMVPRCATSDIDGNKEVSQKRLWLGLIDSHETLFFQLESGESTSFGTNELLNVTACCGSSSNFVTRRMYRFCRTTPPLRDFHDSFLFDFTCVALCGETLATRLSVEF